MPVKKRGAAKSAAAKSAPKGAPRHEVTPGRQSRVAEDVYEVVFTNYLTQQSVERVTASNATRAKELALKRRGNPTDQEVHVVSPKGQQRAERKAQQRQQRRVKAARKESEARTLAP